jgi:predicted transcriptional regulator of viral defense system
MTPRMKISDDRIVDIFRQQHGLLRTGEAIQLGIRPARLNRLRQTGVVERIGWGLYQLSEAPDSAYPDLVAVASQVPHAVICLISALAFHELTTQIPHVVDIAIDVHARRPALSYPPVRIFFFSGVALSAGVETHLIAGRAVPIYSAEKSVADAFKYRNKIGLDVALEALRFYLQPRRQPQVDRLLKYARICRVEKIMRAYLEALL